ncbi:hypothetical protein V6N13_007871 [Hibiscus sabdariffa]
MRAISIISDPSTQELPQSKEGKFSVGGVLSDHEGSILMKFSHRSGDGSALLAEILAIKYAVEHFVNSIWFSRTRLIVESDSKISVEWISSPSSSVRFKAVVPSLRMDIG